MLLCVLIAIRALASADPFAGVGRRMALGAGAIGLYAVLELVSGAWSHAPGVARVEFDLPLVYALAMVLCGSVPRTDERLRWIVRGIAAACVVVCACALITRVLPRVWPTAPNGFDTQLSFPVTYWNTLGLIAAIGIVLCVHCSSDREEHSAVRAAAAAVVPILACTLYFTFSRGASAACVIALLVYACVARPRALAGTALVVAPLTAAALIVAYGANLLAGVHPTTPAAVAQGHRVAIAVALCALAAGALRVPAARSVDSRLERVALGPRLRRRLALTGSVALAALLAIAAIGLSGKIASEYHRFLKPTAPGDRHDLRARFSDPANGFRVAAWKVAWRDFERAPVFGHGAGTFQYAWARYRPAPWGVRAAHSLYLQTLDEVGAVGLVLLLVSILTVLGRVVALARGPRRPLYAAVLAVMLLWALHAAVDWDWEMPVVSVLFFTLGGFVLAREQAVVRRTRAGPRPLLRGALAAGFLALAVMPAYVWLSQRKLDQAVYAFSKGDCAAARGAASSSASILGDRAEPYEVLGYCELRLGAPKAAVSAMARAVALAPGDWSYRYGLALVRAGAGLDPVPAARQALALNPLEPRVQFAWRAFRSVARARWPSYGKGLAAVAPL